ncbi:hypothetical protein Y032_0021g262 [Ancylostoma ceylanicum]|uniref:Mos1 transposase HTH domain-containing protein n=1 Tax=Ancylostoma ceylanicum TaxID=53326 RepID=A0A016V1G8_9BILA|nr:hypothetical protein Y032_0021g262 [Ancylostoma ceylanicum]
MSGSCSYERFRGTSAATAAANIKRAFKETLVNERMLRLWFVCSTQGETDFEDRPCPGRLQSLDNSALLTAIKE